MSVNKDEILRNEVNESSEVAEAGAEAAKKTLGFGFWLSVVWLFVISMLALLAPVLPLKDPGENFVQYEEQENPLTKKLEDQPTIPPYSPSSEHWFGTDQDARDIFSRTIYGARISLAVGGLTTLFGLLIGGSLGMLAGFLKGWIDKLVSGLFLLSLSFPGLVLTILIITILDRSLLTISLTFGILSIAPIGRLARAQTLTFSEREFVTAATTLGAKRSRILLRELFPNVLIPMITLAMVVVAISIVGEGTLAFLGLSVQGSSTWGKLILLGADISTLQTSPWVSFIPMSFLFLTVAAFNFMSDRLQDVFDTRSIYVTHD